MSVLSPKPPSAADLAPLRTPYDNSGDPHILDFLTLVFRAKWVLLMLTIVGGVGMFWLTYKMPQRYEAQATILPPDKNSSIGLLDKFKGQGEALKMLKAVENPSVDLLQNILESRTIDNRLAADSACQSYYIRYVKPRGEYLTSAEWIHDALRVESRISKIFVVADVETGWFSEGVENDAAKTLSARIPMLAVAEMNRFIDQELRSTFRTSREASEAQFAVRKAEFDSLSSALERFESEHRIVSLPKQIESLVRTAAIMRTQLVQDEMKRAIAAEDQLPNSQQMTDLGHRIEAVTSVLTENEAASAIGPGFRELPSLQQELAGLELRIKTLEPIVNFLQLEIEQNRINESRDHTTVQLLDPAVVPKKKTAPKRLPFLLLGLTAGLAAVGVYVVVRRMWFSLKAEAADRSGLVEQVA